jgi:hypothetical protein
MKKVFQENSSLGEVLKVEESLFGQRLSIGAVENLQSVLSFGIADDHRENSVLAFILILSDLHKSEITGFPFVLSTGFSFE